MSDKRCETCRDWDRKSTVPAEVGVYHLCIVYGGARERVEHCPQWRAIVAPICRNCALATWQRGPSGRVRPMRAGECGWKPPDIPLPMASRPGVSRHARLSVPLGGIWYNDTEECRCFVPMERVR